MRKGIAVILETIMASVILLATFNFFVPRRTVESKWDDVLLLTLVRDLLASLDRVDGIGNLVRNSTLLQERLNLIISYPYIWYAIAEFSNGTREEIIKFKPMVSSQEMSYFDVYKENLAKNPGFELGKGGDAYNWTEGNYSRTSLLYHSGSYSMWSNFTGDSFAISDPVSVKPGSVYVLRGWVYNSLTSGTAYLDLNDIPGECNATSTTGLNQWEYVNCVFVTGPGTTEVRVRLVTDNANGEVWFDDVGIDEFTVANLKLFVGYPF